MSIVDRRAEQFNLRLPDGMRDRIKADAARNNRSMNAEIVYLLEAALVTESAVLPLVRDLAQRVTLLEEGRG